MFLAYEKSDPFTAFLLIIPEVRSQVICYEEAKRRAEEFFNHSERRERPLKSGSLACADTLLTICAPGESPGQGGLNPASGRQEPLLYIFNRLDGEGFVILSADERVGDVLAWSSDSRICEVIPPMKMLLDQYAREIVFAREKDIEGGTRLKYALTARSPCWGMSGGARAPIPLIRYAPMMPPQEGDARWDAWPPPWPRSFITTNIPVPGQAALDIHRPMVLNGPIFLWPITAMKR